MALKRGLGNKRMRTGFFWAKIMVNGEKWGLPTGIGVGDMALEVGGTRGMEVGGTRGLGVGGHGALPGFRGRAVGGVLEPGRVHRAWRGRGLEFNYYI